MLIIVEILVGELEKGYMGILYFWCNSSINLNLLSKWSTNKEIWSFLSFAQNPSVASYSLFFTVTHGLLGLGVWPLLVSPASPFFWGTDRSLTSVLKKQPTLFSQGPVPAVPSDWVFVSIESPNSSYLLRPHLADLKTHFVRGVFSLFNKQVHLIALLFSLISLHSIPL
jgi:hypothetical protein